MAEAKALACELPAEQGVPLSRWSGAEISGEAVERGIVAEISGTTVWRWLSEDAIRPWNYYSWNFPRDPQFKCEAGPILDLYEGRWQGQRCPAAHLEERAIEIRLLSDHRRDLVAERTRAQPAALAPAGALPRARALA